MFCVLFSNLKLHNVLCLIPCGVAEQYCLQKQSAAVAKHLNRLTNVRFVFVLFQNCIHYFVIQVKYKQCLGLQIWKQPTKSHGNILAILHFGELLANSYEPVIDGYV